jgi:hypothetical protein
LGKKVKTFAIFLCLVGASFASEFSRETVIGITLELADQKTVENYRFTEAGDVIATLGKKDGPLAGPVLQWTVEKGKLRIFDDSRERIFSLEDEKAEVIIVRDEKGRKLKFYRKQTK